MDIKTAQEVLKLILKEKTASNSYNISEISLNLYYKTEIAHVRK
jgi:hypothetical protein